MLQPTFGENLNLYIFLKKTGFKNARIYPESYPPQNIKHYRYSHAN